MKIFKNCTWDQIGDGGPSIGIRIFKRLADDLSESITALYLEAYRLHENEKSQINKAA